MKVTMWVKLKDVKFKLRLQFERLWDKKSHEKFESRILNGIPTLILGQDHRRRK